MSTNQLKKELEFNKAKEQIKMFLTQSENTNYINSIHNSIIDEFVLKFNANNIFKTNLESILHKELEMTTIIKGDFMEFENYNLHEVFDILQESIQNKNEKLFDDEFKNDEFNENFNEIL